ncbi:MAG: 1-acyl-sn-glycerol-3-phosphate acyltransferase [Bacteroides sp.]|nr:1-acyl-sn-glycerol-3-phosphate acyltransferase [Bacteroides sp.]
MNTVTALAKAAMYIMFRPKVIWEDRSMKKGLKNTPCIFTANHTSHTDGLFAGAVLNRYKPYSLVAKDWYDKKFMGFFLKKARTVPIDRYNPDADWYVTGQELIKNGSPMLIFPEGSTSKDGSMKEFKPGAALLAAKTGAPVIPCAIGGGYKKFFGERQRMIIGRAIEMQCPDGVRLSAFAKRQTVIVQESVKELLKKI